jgi:hypothetical protein
MEALANAEGPSSQELRRSPDGGRGEKLMTRRGKVLLIAGLDDGRLVLEYLLGTRSSMSLAYTCSMIGPG